MITKIKLLMFVIILTTIGIAGCSKYNSDIVKINLKDDKIKIQNSDVELSGNQIIISTGGEYEVSGKAENIQLIVDCQEPVTLILDGVEIINETITPIDIVSKSNVIIECVGRNQSSIITDSLDKDTCIKSEGDIEILGDTKLYLEGHNCINTEKDIFISGQVEALAQGDAIKADQVEVSGGNINISTEKDGIQAKDILINSGDIIINGTSQKARGIYSKGSIEIYGSPIIINTNDDSIHAKDTTVIQGGSITLDTQNDAIHANNSIEINGGNIIVNNCFEGIESEFVTINGGEINITSSNDAINAANDDKDKKDAANIYINGGKIKVDADGDGLDANGSIYFSGGILFASGAYGGDNNAIDFDDEFIINGGTIIAAGNNLKAKPPSEDSIQNSVMIIFNIAKPENESFVLTDEYGNVLVAADFPKGYDNLIITNPALSHSQTFYFGTSYIEGLENDFLLNDEGAEYNIHNFDQFIISSKVSLVWE